MKKGIWYEAPRNRYRVRVYYYDVVVHLSYHSTYQEAEAAWIQAHRKKRHSAKPFEAIGLRGQIMALDYL